MNSSQVMSDITSLGRALAPICGLAAAIVGWRAAFLWRKASTIELPGFAPPLASINDAPEIHIMNVMVQLNSTADALRKAGKQNEAAARWTAFSALLTGCAVLMGTL